MGCCGITAPKRTAQRISCAAEDNIESEIFWHYLTVGAMLRRIWNVRFIGEGLSGSPNQYLLGQKMNQA
jgi:hypothetical protein